MPVHNKTVNGLIPCIMQSLRTSIILSIKLAFEASVIIEKLIWIAFAILGSTHFGHLLVSQIVSWNEHSVMTLKGYERISDIDYPALTFCTMTNSKYAIMERIGNVLGMDSDFTKKHILPVRNDIIEIDVNDESSYAEFHYKEDCLGDYRYKNKQYVEFCQV